MMLTVQSVQSDVAGPYDRTEVTWQNLVGWHGRIRCRHVAVLLVNDWVPRGPIVGCHVAPQNWLISCM
jgi:hypothetical protein